MISYHEALKVALSRAKPFGKEEVPLLDSLNRVLAEEIISPRDLPPFNRSAMDGIAIRYADFEAGDRVFSVAETIFAGQPHQRDLKRGECYKIMTGAAVPRSADTVIQNELLSFSADTVSLQTENCKEGQNIATKGQDLKQDQSVIKETRLISSTMVGLLASLGYQTVKVKKQPRIALLTTGNEVKPLGTTLSDTQIYNSNSYLLQSLLKKNDIEAAAVAHIADDILAIKNAISAHLEKDIIILNGGVSAGDADFIPSALTQLGVKCLFHKVAIKPGKPLWCGQTPAGGMVFALPGNPLSCMVTFTLFVLPFIRKCWGLEDVIKPNRLPFSGERKKKGQLDEFFPAQANLVTQEISLCPSNGSGDIRLGLYANAIAHHPRDLESLEAGKMVEFFLI